MIPTLIRSDIVLTITRESPKIFKTPKILEAL
jgi:hypothetical protein